MAWVGIAVDECRQSTWARQTAWVIMPPMSILIEVPLALTDRSGALEASEANAATAPQARQCAFMYRHLAPSSPCRRSARRRFAVCPSLPPSINSEERATVDGSDVQSALPKSPSTAAFSPGATPSPPPARPLVDPQWSSFWRGICLFWLFLTQSECLSSRVCLEQFQKYASSMLFEHLLAALKERQGNLIGTSNVCQRCRRSNILRLPPVDFACS